MKASPSTLKVTNAISNTYTCSLVALSATGTAGLAIGIVVSFALLCALPAFIIASITKAFTRKTRRWIVAGIIGAVVLVSPLVINLIVPSSSELQVFAMVLGALWVCVSVPAMIVLATAFGVRLLKRKTSVTGGIALILPPVAMLIVGLLSFLLHFHAINLRAAKGPQALAIERKGLAEFDAANDTLVKASGFHDLKEVIGIDFTEISSLRAKLALLFKNYPQTLKHLEAALRSDPSNSSHLFDIGGTRPEDESNFTALGKSDFDLLVAKCPGDYRAYMVRGVFYSTFDEKYYSLAISDLEQAQKLKSSSALVEYFLASVYKKSGFLTEAAWSDMSDSGGYRDKVNTLAFQHFKAAANLDSAFGEAYVQAASMLYKLRRYSEAIPYYDKVLELDPNNAGAYHDRGLAKTNTGDYYGAINDFSKAIAKANRYESLSYESRAAAYVKVMNYDSAIQDYSSAIGLKFGSRVIVMSIPEIRAIYPEFSDISDQDLVEGLRQKYFPRISQAYFSKELQENKKPIRDSMLADLYRSRGDALRSGGNVTRAATDYTRATSVGTQIANPTLVKSTAAPDTRAIAATTATGEDQPLDLPSLAHRERRAVVLIVGYDASGKPTKTGSGFFISEDGRLVTNGHVVDGIARVQAKLENGAIYNIDGVLASSSALDLAVLKADAHDVQFLAVDPAATPPEPGTRIAVIGSPLALEGSLSEGIVSANRSDEDGIWLQISAPISEGSSGSPVLDRHGRVVGVATLTAKEGQNLNFARSSRDLAKFLSEIQADAKPIAFSQPTSQPTLVSEPDYIAAVDANDKRDGATALELVNKLSRRYPNSINLLFERGRAYFNLGLYEDAFSAYGKYVKVKPNEPAAWHNMALSAFNANRYDDALNAGLQAVKMLPDPDTWRMISVIAASREDWASANLAMEQAKKAEAEQQKMPRKKGINESTPSTQSSPETPGTIVYEVQGSDCHVIHYKTGWNQGDLINTRSGPGQNYSVADQIAIGEKGLVMEFRGTQNGETSWVKVFRWNSEKKDSATFIGWANRRFLQFDNKDVEQEQKAAGEKNAAEGAKFLDENKRKEGVKTTASGLQYKVIKEGTGAQPKATDTVTVNYSGKLISGKEFDSSYTRGQPATFPLNGVIKGWTEGIQLMKVGSKYQLFVPSDLGFGERTVGPNLAPNSTLIFDVELLDIKPAER